MQISSYGSNPYAQTRPAERTAGQGTAGQTAGESSAAAKPGASEAFLAEIRKTPAQRIREAWLASHRLSEEDLKTMDPAKREAIEKEIAEDLKRKLTGKETRRGSMVDMSA
ncbi:hypothetical protein [Azospirillum thermophilum]|uniref:Uncharacterized protein n=1 Tax=Azospirillum thermophilum TaxID=2202148 RepID=A0A2S2CNI6_9PROT|nr:hypothetical protein [Azospirillum thermophilum]AWK86018.1 hypothetical protein DEW08_06920 [Azospirillum thermophilum]